MPFDFPYADVIGARRNNATGEPILTIGWRHEVEGRPGFVHGGVIGGLLEMACYEALDHEFGRDEQKPRLKPINISIDYLRGGVMTDTHAVAHIVRIGKRVANASAVCWQDDRSRPIATARMHILLDR
ncbi:PaaI family thioesterase [Rhizorhabdus dicambivorans]|uniref:PaaI family thioesterase n=1 Tax=Rhizorhabdus dicambivorans TaxID=1850238 RepID=A0A2A4G158_9SPHN|nr:PaaI family thioesterase [Rhizorhabdus dicambivorans]ATE64947.1 PaaI family thioesterase [Rhizorhabdus dicambivorans]PCE44221.1 PaaI family thioesterase [Rhizorhabdus dicambivorans]